MKIKSINLENIPPLKLLKLDELGDVVIIAGANGSGKTRLKEAITEVFRNPSSPQLAIVLDSTRPEEEKYWGAKDLKIEKGVGNQIFINYMNSRIGGANYVGTAINIDSQRSIVNPQFPTLNLSVVDPDDSDLPSTWYLDSFSSKWNEIIDRIYKKIASRDLKIAKYAKKNPEKTFQDFLKSFPDPFLSYQEIFKRLILDKTLDPISPNNPKEFTYRLDSTNERLSFGTLSSGEQEVVKIAFYILAKKINHCVFLIDEPELHLHPTLSFRLVETLKETGGSTNQFIFFTHSADLISTYYSSGNVYFIDTDRTGVNQAHKLSDLNESHSQLVELMSENLGLFAVGKILIFVEGQQSSLDRLTYHSVAQKYFPEAHITPVESVSNILKLKDFSKEIEKTVFGVHFYMIRDRDGLSETQIEELEQSKRLLCLKKRHLENYFLDAEILAKVAERFCLNSELQIVQNIEKELKKIAEQQLNLAIILGIKEFTNLNREFEIPNIKSVDQKNLEDIKKEYVEKISEAISKVNDVFGQAPLDKVFQEEESKLKNALVGTEWKNLFPGKVIFNQFCNSVFQDEPIKVRTAYVEIALAEKPKVFQDVIDIFNTFKQNK